MPSPLAPKAIPGVTSPKETPTAPKVVVGDANGIVGQTSSTDKGFNILDPTGVGAFLGKLQNVYLWKRVGIVVIGALFIWWGILLFLATNKKIQGAVATGAKAVISKTPEGAAANIATGAVGL